jgi:pimeloyl-ACP methyl ester carboxylesterase
MNVHPVFVPVEGDHVAATISLPDVPARGLAVLLQGFGTTRSHRNRLWTKTSAALAARGIASVRLDYPGLGDSTGTRLYSMKQPPVQAVIAATRVALDAAGVNSYCVVGNCLGARTALLIAERLPGCLGVGLVLPGELESVVREEPSPTGTSALRLVARDIPALRRMARLVPRRSTRSARLMPEVGTLMDSVRMLFLFIGPRKTWRRLAPVLDAWAGRAGTAARGRVERLFVPGAGRQGLQPLSSQEAVLQVVPEWIDRVVSGSTLQLEPAAARGTRDGLTIREGDVFVHVGDSRRTSSD